MLKISEIKEILSAVKERWENELSSIYGGELEINRFSDGNIYACAFHDQPKDGYDSSLTVIEEIECLGNDKLILDACKAMGIPVCDSAIIEEGIEM